MTGTTSRAVAQQGTTLHRALSDTEKAAGEATRSGWWPSSYVEIKRTRIQPG